MAKKEETTIWYVIVGIALIVAIVGFALVMGGKTGGVAVPTYTRGAVCISGEEACTASLACEGIKGGILLGDGIDFDPRGTGHYACLCDEHLLDATVGQWGGFRTTIDGSVYNPDHLKLIAKCRNY